MAEAAFTEASTSGGLPDDLVNEVEIDSAGNVWAGTCNGGVVSFDGTTWTSYNRGNGCLPDNNVQCVEIDSTGKVWVGTEDGVSVYDGATWTLYCTANSNLPTDEVRAIGFAPNGRTWVSMYGVLDDGGVAVLDGTTWTVYNSANGHPIHRKAFALAFEANGTVWVASDTGIAVMRDGAWTLYNSNTNIVSDPYPAASLTSVAAIVVDDDGTVWCGGYGGLFSVSGTSWHKLNETSDGIPHTGLVTRIYIDAKGNKWLGTWGKGLFVYNETGLK